MAFRKPPTVDVPAGIESYLDDVTLSGVSMEALAKETLEEDLSVGRIGILVDHPLQPGNVTALTVNVAQQMGLRPTLQLYTAESIRNWKFARVNNAWVLSMVVLGEPTAVPKDEFSEETEDRYRVLDLDESGLYRQRVFKVEKEQDVLLSELYPLMNGKPLTFVPFFIIGAGGKGDCIDEPPLIDLIDKNLAHYQVNSDYRHGLHFTGLPTAVPERLSARRQSGQALHRLAGRVGVPRSERQGRVPRVHRAGPAIDREALDRIEKQMAMLGARMIADESKQVETLGATQIKRQGENSVLSKIVQAVSEALEWALTVFAQWAGQSGDVTYQLNRDFMPANADAERLASLTKDVLIDGAPSSAWWEQAGEDTAFKFAAQVRQGWSMERRTSGSLRALSVAEPGIMDVARRNARALVHSSVMSAANDARLATFRKNAALSPESAG
jgi:hypothetical protein